MVSPCLVWRPLRYARSFAYWPLCGLRRRPVLPGNLFGTYVRDWNLRTRDPDGRIVSPRFGNSALPLFRVGNLWELYGLSWCQDVYPQNLSAQLQWPA
eukprot:7750507-Heterocapsa_arctica.AAC.1